MIRALFLILTIALATTANAAPAAAPAKPADSRVWQTLKKGVLIRINSYLPEKDVYDVTVTTEEAVGPLHATPEDLLKSLPDLDAKKVMAAKASIVDREMTLDLPLPVLTAKAVAERARRLQH